MRGMLGEFRTFLLRGNVIDLAVAVVIGAAFNSVVQALVRDWITPLIAVLTGAHKLESLSLNAGGIIFPYGDFLNAVISFLLIAAVVFFLVVKPINAMVAYSKRREAPVEPDTKKCPECLSPIPSGARRCMYCTSEQPAPGL